MAREDAMWASLDKANQQFPKSIILMLNKITEILQNHQKTRQAPQSAVMHKKKFHVHANKRCPGQQLCLLHFPFSACYVLIYFFNDYIWYT